MAVSTFLSIRYIQFIFFLYIYVKNVQPKEVYPVCSETNQCFSSLKPSDCYQSIITTNDENCGCPKCEKGPGFGKECSFEKCAPGLQCQRNICVYNKSTCAYTLHLETDVPKPLCDIDGSFAAVQCRNDLVAGRCFCYSQDGERIFGWGQRSLEKNMTCACSRFRHNRSKLFGLNDDTLHCNEMGNYEPLQCNKGYCWCADERNGNVVSGTRVVPRPMWKFLPCYSTIENGIEYLRKCESAVYAQYLIKRKLETHGTILIHTTYIDCDYDGAFGKKLVEDGHAYCQWRDGSKIGSYQDSLSALRKMDCNCARDMMYFDKNLPLACSGLGNYETKQETPKIIFCVDRDGVAVGPTKYINETLDCSKYLYYDATNPISDTQSEEHDYSQDDDESKDFYNYQQSEEKVITKEINL